MLKPIKNGKLISEHSVKCPHRHSVELLSGSLFCKDCHKMGVEIQFIRRQSPNFAKSWITAGCHR